MLQVQDYMGLQVLDRSLISIGFRKAACDALAHIRRRHTLSELVVEVPSVYSLFQSRTHVLYV